MDQCQNNSKPHGKCSISSFEKRLKADSRPSETDTFCRNTTQQYTGRPISVNGYVANAHFFSTPNTFYTIVTLDAKDDAVKINIYPSKFENDV